MMKGKLMRQGLLLVLMLLWASGACAGGLGLFISGGEVDAEWDGDYSRVDNKGQHRDFGFVIDSNLENDRLFNYRFELGRAAWEVDDFAGRGRDADLDGLVMNHDFGFGGLIAPPLRLWFGPELRFTLLEGDLDNVSTHDIDLFGYGVGAAVGLNFNFPGRLSLSTKLAGVMMRYVGDGPDWNNGTSSWVNSDYDVDEDLVYLSLSIFFRTTSSR